MRVATFGLLGLLALTSCEGEAEVSYKGSVVAADSAGTSFDKIANPMEKPPIATARVSLCIDECKSPHVVTTDAQGRFAGLSQVFGGFAGKKNDVEVRFEADGYDAYSYKTTFEDTNDPTNAEMFLNASLTKASN